MDEEHDERDLEKQPACPGSEETRDRDDEDERDDGRREDEDVSPPPPVGDSERAGRLADLQKEIVNLDTQFGEASA